MKRALLLLMLIASPLQAAEKWYEAYNRGVAAVNSRSYAAAAEALQRAIAEVPTESTAARARNQTIVYVPHFWLGIARLNLGDADAALREWKISEEQGAIQNTEYYAKLRDWVGSAQAEKRKLAQAASGEARKATDAAVSRAMSAQMDAVAAGADRKETYRAGQRKLQDAIDQFNKAGTDSRSYQRAAEIANQAQELFKGAADEARQAKAARPAHPPAAKPVQTAPPVEVAHIDVKVESKSQQQPQPPPVTPQPTAAAPPPAQQQAATPSPAPAPIAPVKVESEAAITARVGLQQYRNRLVTFTQQHRDNPKFRRTLRDAAREADRIEAKLRAANDGPSYQRVASLVAEQQRMLDDLLASAPVAPSIAAALQRPQIEPAFRAFASGDLARSDQLLSRMIDTTPAAEVFLLRGCTRYTQAMLSRSPGALLDSAAADFRSALRLDRTLRLDKRAFSPKLVAYFEQVKRAK